MMMAMVATAAVAAIEDCGETVFVSLSGLRYLHLDRRSILRGFVTTLAFFRVFFFLVLFLWLHRISSGYLGN